MAVKVIMYCRKYWLVFKFCGLVPNRA